MVNSLVKLWKNLVKFFFQSRFTTCLLVENEDSNFSTFSPKLTYRLLSFLLGWTSPNKYEKICHCGIICIFLMLTDAKFVSMVSNLFLGVYVGMLGQTQDVTHARQMLYGWATSSASKTFPQGCFSILLVWWISKFKTTTKAGYHGSRLDYMTYNCMIMLTMK